MSMIVLPYLVAGAASHELTRPALEAPGERRARTVASAPDPLEGLKMRLTYRTVRVLSVIAEQAMRLLDVPIPKTFHRAKRADELSFRSLLGNLNELVGGAPQRAHNHDGMAIDPRRDDRRRARDGVRVTDGGATELADDHAGPA